MLFRSANFNATAVACGLEMARVLGGLMDSGTFPKPLRGIRFVFTPKKYGSLAFARQQNEILQKTIYTLYLESSAGNPDKAWSRWGLHRTPICQRHYSDGLAWFILREYTKNWRPQRKLEQRAFSLVGDVYYNDPKIGVPTHWLYGGTDEECRYSDMDTLPTIDRRSLIDLVAASSTLLYTMAAMGLENIPQIAYWNYQLSLERIQEDIRIFKIGRAHV